MIKDIRSGQITQLVNALLWYIESNQTENNLGGSTIKEFVSERTLTLVLNREHHSSVKEIYIALLKDRKDKKDG